MSNNASLISMLIALWHKLNLKRKKQFVGIALLMVLASLSEVISIGIIFPFLGMLTAPEKIMHYSVVQTVVNFVGKGPLGRNKVVLFKKIDHCKLLHSISNTLVLLYLIITRFFNGIFFRKREIHSRFLNIVSVAGKSHNSLS